MAALIDGEGCLNATESGLVQIEMTRPEAVAWAHERFGGNTYTRELPSGKHTLGWSLKKQDDVITLLEAVSPYLQVKRAEALAMLEYVQHRRQGLPHGARTKSVEAIAENDSYRAERDHLQERAQLAKQGLNVLALDPGEKVGWARAVVLPNAEWLDLRHGIHHLKDMALALGRSAVRYDVVIYETWRLYPSMAKSMVGSDFQTSQFIGMVRYLTWINPRVKLVSQGASIKKTADKTAPDWLQEIIDNEPASHDDGHNVDALRHLWFWTWEKYVN